MHVGIDITSILYGRGVSRYTANLVRALADDPTMELSLFGSSFRQRDVLQKAAKRLVAQARHQAKVVIQPIPPKLQEIAWNTMGINPVHAALPGIEVFHSWDWIQPPDKDIPLVSTIHDLAILKYPETAHPHILRAHQASWQKLKERGAEIIAISRATKADVIELLQYPPEKVHVVYEALPTEMKMVAEALSEEQYDVIKEHLELTRPYILFVGTREPRKNVIRLIKAWEPLAKDFDLLIAGEQGWDDTAQFTSNAHLRFLGRVSDQQLVVLYSEASVFAYPCLYEGFGLPILEAFYYGTPVLTANVSSMVEIAGNAAQLVNPNSIEDIREGLNALLHESLPEQQQRLQKMIIRQPMFNLQTVADQTIKVYKQAISKYVK